MPRTRPSTCYTLFVSCVALNTPQSLVRSLHTPVVEAVCSSVRTAHSKSHELPGLPFPELPVVAVSAPGSNSSVVSDVVASLERHGRTTASGGGDAHSACIISQLYPADCPNLMTAMKSLVTSFVDRTDEDGEQDNHGIRCKSLHVHSTPEHGVDASQIRLLCAGRRPHRWRCMT